MNLFESKSEFENYTIGFRLFYLFNCSFQFAFPGCRYMKKIFSTLFLIIPSTNGEPKVARGDRADCLTSNNNHTPNIRLMFPRLVFSMKYA